MNRIFLGISCGTAFGIADALMVVYGKAPLYPQRLQPFFSCFAIGVLAANASFRIHRAVSGAIVDLLISVPYAKMAARRCRADFMWSRRLNPGLELPFEDLHSPQNEVIEQE
jgi:hypothetical protein